MRHLNYNHLLYFWTVAREGSVTKASSVLNLTPQTVSGQIKLLEESIGEPLLARSGRGVTLTSTGHLVNEYAEEIFKTGAELALKVKSDQSGRTQQFHVGVVDSIPKLVAYRILEPTFHSESQVQLICREDSLELLLGDLALHKLDLVVSDRPTPSSLNIKSYDHKLGASAIGLFARANLATRYRRNFPKSLQDAPFLLPATSTALRHSIDNWFHQRDISPTVIGEFNDSALLKAFGEAGIGIFPAPMAIASHIEKMYQAKLVGEMEEIEETYYAISAERRIKHEFVLAITESAREHIFA